MPWKSKAQMRAAHGGYLGAEMKARAGEWDAETPSAASLPDHVLAPGKRKKRSKMVRMAPKRLG